MTLDEVSQRLAQDHLDVLGTCKAVPEDNIGDGTIVLIGPREPGFWAAYKTTSEFRDGAPDPMDRWSDRVISGAAHELNGQPLFPFGEPVRPFFTWAERSGRIWPSPVQLLVHDNAGLWVSFRGAMLIQDLETPPSQTARPCDTCYDQPCLSACPVGALTDSGYDLDRCHAYLDTEPGQDCMTKGCAVRRACPVGQSFDRQPDQSAYHMRQFHR